MPTLVQIRNRVDAWLADRWTTLAARQELFVGDRGRYWQGLPTHSEIPLHTTEADGDAIPDRYTRETRDQNDRWADIFPEWEAESIPCLLRVDAYIAPGARLPSGGARQTPGYVASIWLRHDGVTYARSQNVGPLDDRTHGWRRVDVASLEDPQR
jgi:hypothetical protein